MLKNTDKLLRAFRALPLERQTYLLGFAEGLAHLPLPGEVEQRPQRRDLRLGDRVPVWPCIDPARPAVRQMGTVVYIHPLRRYYTVALDRGCRQAFPWGAAE